MITNLFSLFDPTMRVFSFVWLVGVLFLLFFPISFNNIGQIGVVFYNIVNRVKIELDYVIKKSMPGNYLFILSIFLLVCSLNFIALFPFLFSVTSHILVTLPLAYSLWIGIILFRWVKSFSSFLSHLIPVGTPALLLRFIVIVELIRNFIRPLALTFRLTANIIAGHLLISLIGGFLISLPFLSILAGSIIQSLLVIMELGVSIIQAYVFSTLLLLYFSEGER